MRHVHNFSHDYNLSQLTPYYFCSDLIFLKAFVVGMRKESPTRTNSHNNKEIFLFQNLQTGSGPTQHIVRYAPRGFFPESKAAGSWRWSAAKFKNAWRCTSSSTYAFIASKGAALSCSYIQKYEPTQLCLKWNDWRAFPLQWYKYISQYCLLCVMWLLVLDIQCECFL
jgi:hypothetical protein